MVMGSTSRMRLHDKLEVVMNLKLGSQAVVLAPAIYSKLEICFTFMQCYGHWSFLGLSMNRLAINHIPFKCEVLMAARRYVSFDCTD